MGAPGFVSRIFNIAAAVLALALAIGLYRAKTEADTARARVSQLESDVAAAKAELKILSAEVAMLENPERIEKLAKEKLGLRPATPRQVKKLSELGAKTP
jgi:cell division protein FtsL